ncbi:unnamed protein product [Heterobilharzia americana]|nr:unnamed protein product [Heterobilharzia americana]
MESTEVNSAAQPDISEVTNSTTTTTTKTNSSNSIIADTVNENEDVVQKDVVNTVKQTIDTNSDVSNPSETTTISYENNELKSISIVREISPQKEYHVASTTEATPSSEAVLTNEDNINYTPKSEATPIDIEISKDMVDETLLKIVETPIEIRKKMAIKVVDEQIQSRGSEMVEEMKTKEISSSTSPSSTKKQIKLSLSLSPDTSSQEVVNTLNELSTTTSTGQSIDGITEPMITETIVKRHNKQQADNPSSESFNSELQTIDTTYVKHPQRPPPPKLNSVKKTQTSLNSSHSSYNDTNEVMTNGISTDSHYKRPSFKSNLKHAFSNLRKSFKRKNKSSHQSYNGSSQQPTHKNNHYIDYNDNHNNGNHQQYNDAHYLSHQDYQSPEEIPESHSNVQSLDPSISDSLQYQREEFDILNPIENIAPPAIPTKMSSDPNQPIYVNHSLQTTNMLDNKNTEHSDYPTRLRERIHVYRPVSSSATVSATLPYNGYDRNMTLKPYKPKAIAERYKCSEVYSWPPKFPKLKRRKTQPPKQIHTGQDHVVIKEQIKPPMNYQPPVPNQTHTNEPLHVIKVSQQWNTLNNKRDSDNSPERQVTSLHSVQRSTLLEQSNRTSGPGPGSRNQLFIADYKQMPSSQVSSEKPNSLALPYFTKAAENKRFSKFHFTTANNAINDNNINNNIVMSSEVMQSESPKSIGVLKDTVKAMHPFLQEWFEKHKELDNKELKDEERKNDKLVINCLSEYLFTCMKLRSLDLQGEYASFVFPLKSFNEKSWDKYGFIEGWEELSIVCAPNTNHEYVVLNQCDKQSNKLKYTTKTVDKLLTNWLNSQTTKSPLPNGHTSFDNLTANKNKSIEDKALHSIVLTTTLKSILSLFDNKEAGVDIFETCIKLSVLLSLSECLPTSLDRSEVNKTHSEVDLTPENILLILSPSNCLTVFKKFDKIQPTNNHMDKSNDLSNKDDAEKHDAKQALNKENTLKSLFNQLHLHGDSINEVINDILKHLYEITKHEFIFPEMVTSLLKAVAPPDWIAICLARICLYNQTSQ